MPEDKNTNPWQVMTQLTAKGCDGMSDPESDEAEGAPHCPPSDTANIPGKAPFRQSPIRKLSIRDISNVNGNYIIKSTPGYAKATSEEVNCRPRSIPNGSAWSDQSVFYMRTLMKEKMVPEPLLVTKNTPKRQYSAYKDAEAPRQKNEDQSSDSESSENPDGNEESSEPPA